MIRGLPLPAGADVVVLGDSAYDAEVVHQACADRSDLWIVPKLKRLIIAAIPKEFRVKG